MAFLCHAVPILPRNISPPLLYLTQFNPHLCVSQPVSLFTTRTFPSCITPGNKKESINVLYLIYLCSSEGKLFFFSVWFQLVTEWYSLLKMSFCMWLALKSTSYNIRSNPENWTQKNLTQGPLTTFFPELSPLLRVFIGFGRHKWKDIVTSVSPKMVFCDGFIWLLEDKECHIDFQFKMCNKNIIPGRHCSK